MTHDVIAAADEGAPFAARPLLQRMMAGGRRVVAAEPLSGARERCRATLSALPPELQDLQRAGRYEVQVSDELEARRTMLAASHGGAHADSPA